MCDLTRGLVLKEGSDFKQSERIFDFGDGGDSNNVLLGRLGTSDDLQLIVHQEGDVVGVINIAGALSGIEGEWHHYGVSIDSNNAELFIDGKLVGTRVLTGLPDYSNWNENYIGSSNSSANKRFQGAMDDIAIFDSALTESEMRTLAKHLIDEQQPLDIHGTGLSVSDVDDGGGILTATITVGEGRVLVDAGDTDVELSMVAGKGSGNFASGNGTDEVTFTGTKAQINNLLAGAGTGTIVYTADSDTPSASTTLTLTVNDKGNTGNDPDSTGGDTSKEDSVSQTITISSINDSPELLSPNLVVNGDFSSGNLSGWTTTNIVSNQSGQMSFGGGNKPGPHTASQVIETVAGETYSLEFDYWDIRDKSKPTIASYRRWC